MVTQCYAGKKQTRKPLHGSSSSAHACPQGWRTWLGLSAPAQVPRSAELRWAEPGGLGLAHLLHEVFGSHCGHLDCQGPAHSFYWLFIQDIYKMQSGCYLYWLLEKKVRKKKISYLELWVSSALECWNSSVVRTQVRLAGSLQNDTPAQSSGAESPSDLGVDINFKIWTCSSISESHWLHKSTDFY